ncbi:unnamed protein product [Phytophthora fragariaefolia]|uniref:Unnamed protein product n=1 Tax=Phytophthora fragariaefolia TaxID=1490495 RepID=A0A9W7D4P6_9STRA|nr:unnamed protein product [Phytophthora fragariaefolia]
MDNQRVTGESDSGGVAARVTEEAALAKRSITESISRGEPLAEPLSGEARPAESVKPRPADPFGSGESGPKRESEGDPPWSS